MPKTLKQQRKKTMVAVSGGESGISVVGTKRWNETVPVHLREPLAKALSFMEQNDLGQALWWFGECMQRMPAIGWEAQAKPVLYFGGQMAAQGYFSLKSREPHHPQLAEWRQMALDLVTAAYEAAPDDPVARHNAGRFLQDCGDDAAAIAHYRHTLLLDSTQVETWGNLGTALYQQGDPAEAWRCWDRCVSLDAEMASGRLSQAYIWLRKGEYQKGWAAYNDRWKDLVFQREYGRQAQLGPQHWLGEPLPKSHRLFLHGEQGLGDHIQFARYVPLLLERGINLVGLETRAVLSRWMEASFPDLPIFRRDETPLPSFTHHCSTLDLPGILGATLETIPPPIAPSLRAAFDPRDDRTLRAGIAWEGAKGNPADDIRSIPPEHLIHLSDISGVTWVNLQFAPDASMTARAWLGKNVVDGTEGCRDTLDTAAVMRGLDLVICVDTATAHLAGTLGTPTWVLHRYCREWRWLDQGEASPWYPSIRSLTQPKPGDWTSLLQQVRAELETMTR